MDRTPLFQTLLTLGFLLDLSLHLKWAPLAPSLSGYFRIALIISISTRVRSLLHTLMVIVPNVSASIYGPIV
jgi:hypothetical protein